MKLETKFQVLYTMLALVVWWPTTYYLAPNLSPAIFTIIGFFEFLMAILQRKLYYSTIIFTTMGVFFLLLGWSLKITTVIPSLLLATSGFILTLIILSKYYPTPSH